MDITSNPIQSYQNNQNIGGSSPNSEAQAATSAELTPELENQDDAVYISDLRKIYQWVAAEFPQVTANPATVSRASQMLYEYQLLDFNDINTINSLVAGNSLTESSDVTEKPITAVLDNALSSSESYFETQSLTHLKQVFSTLEAAVT
jgi:hypothetical protein